MYNITSGVIHVMGENKQGKGKHGEVREDLSGAGV